MKYFETLIEDQETTISILYKEQIIRVYSSEPRVIQKLSKELGKPTEKYIKSKTYYTGASWDIDFFELDKIQSILIRDNFIDKKTKPIIKEEKKAAKKKKEKSKKEKSKKESTAKNKKAKSTQDLKVKDEIIEKTKIKEEIKVKKEITKKVKNREELKVNKEKTKNSKSKKDLSVNKKISKKTGNLENKKIQKADTKKAKIDEKKQLKNSKKTIDFEQIQFSF